MKSLEIRQKLHENVKSRYILKFAIFGAQIVRFFHYKTSFVSYKSLPDKQFVHCRTSLKLEATKVFQNYTKTA